MFMRSGWLHLGGKPLVIEPAPVPMDIIRRDHLNLGACCQPDAPHFPSKFRKQFSDCRKFSVSEMEF
jgi:hypothetical protein